MIQMHQEAEAGAEGSSPVRAGGAGATSPLKREKDKGAEKRAKDEIATRREVLSCVGGVWELEQIINDS